MPELLKGHQIIGELRPVTIFEPDALNAELKGHQIIGELRPLPRGHVFPNRKLKGHQIIGELRHIHKDRF